MVDKEILQKKIQYIKHTLSKLRVLSDDKSLDFLASFQKVDAAKHNLQVAIEAIVDIANHIVARERYGLPETSADAIELLVQNRILDFELAKSLKLMVKFRNRIVHLYQEVDDEHIYRILQEDLGDIQSFIDVVTIKFLL